MVWSWVIGMTSAVGWVEGCPFTELAPLILFRKNKKTQSSQQVFRISKALKQSNQVQKTHTKGRDRGRENPGRFDGQQPDPLTLKLCLELFRM